MTGLRRTLQRAVWRLRGQQHPDALMARGLRLGRNVHIGPGTHIDHNHCHLISIGDGAVLAPGVHLLAHDASTKPHLGYTRIGRVEIGERAFIGARSVILPNVRVGEGAIVGAGSVVTSDVPPGTLVTGAPADVAGSVKDYVERRRAEMEAAPRYPARGWTVRGGIRRGAMKRMWSELADGPGYIE